MPHLLGRMWKHALALLVCAMTLGSPYARAQDCQTIYQVAQEANLTSLLAAAEAAGLAVPLQDTNSSLTLFAPTNAAFDALLEGLNLSFEQLADNDTLLATVLGYHAVPPNIPTNFAGEQLTLSGPELSIDFPNNRVAQDVNIMTGPVTACLSQIYVIDAVLVPDGFICKEPGQIVQENADLSTLLMIANNAGLQAGPVNPLRTVFAPTNDAFDALLENLGINITELVSDQGRLLQILGYHSIESFLLPDSEGTFEALNGQQLLVDLPGEKVGNGTNITRGPINACLSQIFVVDAVLVPPVQTCHSVLDFAVENGFGALVDLVNGTSLEVRLSDNQEVYTVFAPTDSAFDTLLSQLEISLDQLKTNRTLLAQILGYHVVQPDLLPGVVGSFKALNGQQLAVDLPGRTVGNNVNIASSAGAACLSKVYPIDAVLIPPVLTCQSVIQVAEAQGFTDLVAAVDAAGLRPPLSEPTAMLTVFAPTDEAFNATLAELGLTFEQLAANETLLVQIVSYHVVGGVLPANADGSYEALNGQQLAVDLPGNKVGNNVNITAGPVTACLSEVYVIDAVLIPPVLTCQSVIQVAEAQGYTDLVAAVEAAGLSPQLSNPDAKLTVFAPTNEAFNATLTELGLTFEQLAANVTRLREIVLYHVVEDVLPSDADGSYATLEGEQLAVDLPGNKVGNNVNITAGPVTACLSEVYVIDAVLIPGEESCHTIIQVAEAQGYTDLVAAVEAAGLSPQLSNPDAKLTVFAPTNEAFNATLTELGLTFEQLAANVTRLREIVLYHVVEDVLPSDADGSYATLEGEQLAVDLPGNKVGNNVNITASPVTACSSEVYVIDAVLIPGEESCHTIIQVAEARGYTDLVAAVEAAGLSPQLSNPDAKLTVFAPTNEAFNATLTELGLTFEQLAANVTRLREIVSYHVVEDVLPSDADGSYEALNGQQLAVDLPGNKVGNNVNITAGPVTACLSEVYVIDAGLLPGDPTPDNEGSKTPYSMSMWALSCGIQLGLFFSWLLV